MQQHDELRVAPDGRMARRIPIHVQAEAQKHWSKDFRWLTFGWPEGMLAVELLTDEDVAKWKIAHTEDDDG